VFHRASFSDVVNYNTSSQASLFLIFFRAVPAANSPSTGTRLRFGYSESFREQAGAARSTFAWVPRATGKKIF
jgi:hypothetical protein